jgi:hypothetical protein
MNSTAIRLIVFVCIFGAALLGIVLRATLPERHLSADSKDAVRLGMGMIATMAALVLGLLVASAKNFYDTYEDENSASPRWRNFQPKRDIPDKGYNLKSYPDRVYKLLQNKAWGIR